jgi:hypothetical protein
MWPVQHHQDSTADALFGSALFVSALQGSQEPTADQIRQAIEEMIRAFGSAGCAGRVAQEFGDHPETAATRMRWVRETLAGLAFRVRLAA